MIESRPLNRVEILELLNEAPQSEVRNLIAYLKSANQNAYDFLNKSAVYRYGLVIDGRPVYFAYVVPREKGGFELWTVVNSSVKEQFSLYKYSKIALLDALKQFSPIYATMEIHNHKNIDWVKKMGFKEVLQDNQTISFVIERKKE